MNNYRRGDAVKAVVEDVYPFGVFVRLEDETRAYIRCRELTLEGDVDPRTVVAPGNEIMAVVSKQAELDRIMELSVRNNMPDPWDVFLKQNHVGAVVSGIVKNLYPDRVYVEIVPGVSGFIETADLTTWRVDHPEDLLWTGDHIEAVIQKINPSRKKMQLSIRQRIAQLSEAQSFLEQLRIKQGVTKDADASVEGSLSQEKDTDLSQRQLSLTVLVVEDTPDVREPLLYWLGSHGCRALGTDMVDQAMQIYQQGNFDLALVDLDLPVTGGLTFISQLRDVNTSMTIAVMSDPELIARSMDKLQDLGVSAVFPKPLDLDELLQFLERRSRGESMQLPVGLPVRTNADVLEPYKELSALMRSNRSLSQRFRNGLEKLLQETKAEHAIVFRLDPVSGIISLVTSVGSLPIDEDQVYGLPNSPVNDVINREVLVWENHVETDHQRKFAKLRSLLPFEACIGIPISAGGKTEHALFIFHRHTEFARYHVRSVVSMAMFFSVALEDQLLNERVQALSGLFLSGQLSASFAHEIYNKVSGLDLYLRNLQSDISRLDKKPADQAFDLQPLNAAADSTIKSLAGLKETVRDFRKLMEVRTGDSADINQVINQVISQMQPHAARAGVNMMFVPADGLPRVTGSNLGLLQVSLNLVLNALQQMEKSKLPHRELAVNCTTEGNKVIVRFHDAGPGIHGRLWEKIFDLGFTTRPGGSGIGLFIARSLIESMGGRIMVEESLIPLGSIFRMELPCYHCTDDMKEVGA